MPGKPRRPNRRSIPKIPRMEPLNRTPDAYQWGLLEGNANDMWADSHDERTPYTDHVLNGPSGQVGYDTPLERQYRRKYPHLAPDANQILVSPRDERLRAELQRDRALLWGNDDGLVPHSTKAQSSNPKKPRTTKMGYNYMARELRVKFRGGARYVYYNVPPDVWEEILSADSVGTYMEDHIVHSYMYDQETYNTK